MARLLLVLLSFGAGCTGAPEMDRDVDVRGTLPRIGGSGDPLPPGAIARLGSGRFRHSSGVSQVAVGAALIAAADDDSLHVWNLEDGRERLRFPLTSAALFVAWNGDGTRVSLGSVDGTIRRWDVPSGAELPLLRTRLRDLECMALSPDGKQVVAGTPQGSVQVEELETGRIVRTLDVQDRVSSVRFSQDGLRVASNCRGTIVLWDLATGAGNVRIEGPESFMPQSIAFSPDGRRIVSGHQAGGVRIWDAATGKELLRLEGHRSVVNSVDFSPDGRFVVTASHDRTVRVWDARTGRESATLKGHQNAVLCAAFAPDGETVVSGAKDQLIRTWRAASGEPISRPQGHEGTVDAIAISSDGRTVVTGGSDGTVRTWDAATGREKGILRGHRDEVTGVALSPDGRTIVSSGYDRTVRVWDVESGTERKALEGHHDLVHGVAFTADGKMFVSWGQDRSVRLWDVGKAEAKAALTGFGDIVWDVALAGNGDWLAARTGDGAVALRSLSPSKEVLRIQRPSVDWISVSAGGRNLLTWSEEDRRLRIWDVDERKLIGTRDGIPGRPAAVSPDGRTLAALDTGGIVRLFDLTSGQELRSVRSVGEGLGLPRISGESRIMATACSNGTALLWRLGERR